MIRLYDTGVFLVNGKEIIPNDKDAPTRLKQAAGRNVSPEEAKKGTITHSIVMAHNHPELGATERDLKIKFDSITAHDITYVGIIQTARASGMEKFPLPLVMTNCHNSLCAVGGTINEDDHMFALSAAKKYGGVYVPTNLAVIHSYNREMMAGCGRMILGSDSHTRYGSLGTMAIGEGGGELAKQLVGRTYDLPYPGVIAIYLTGKPNKGVGPHDVALSIIAAVFKNGYVQNKSMEFVGDGVKNISVDFRNGIDVMTTETTCWSSIWVTDSAVKEYYAIHGRPEAYKQLAPADIAYYDGMVHVNLSTIEPVIAMPFHPSNAFTIKEFRKNAQTILAETEEAGRKAAGRAVVNFNLKSKYRSGEVYVDQGIVCGCAGGTFENIMTIADTLEGKSTGNGRFTMSVYPGSQPIYMELIRNGAAGKIMESGAIMREAFCGPCFGAGETPANGEFSIRHTTRNFPSREGAKPGEGQAASVALMDARSIAATAANGGRLTSAADMDTNYSSPKFFFDQGIYEKRVYDGTGKPDTSEELQFGPNIKDWPTMPELTDNLLLKVVCHITDPVTTTDELIPSGETSSFRSNPIRLAEFTLGRKDSDYVNRSKAVHATEEKRVAGGNVTDDPELAAVYEKIRTIPGCADVNPNAVSFGSTIYANKPGDGSAREQAASCQRVLGAAANLAKEYATKRYRSNCINWGMLPFLVESGNLFKLGDYVFFPDIRKALLDKAETITGYVVSETVTEVTTRLGELTYTERRILADGCLINYYKNF